MRKIEFLCDFDFDELSWQINVLLVLAYQDFANREFAVTFMPFTKKRLTRLRYELFVIK